MKDLEINYLIDSSKFFVDVFYVLMLAHKIKANLYVYSIGERVFTCQMK